METKPMIITSRIKGIDACCGMALLYDFDEWPEEACIYCARPLCNLSNPICTRVDPAKSLLKIIEPYYHNRVTIFMATIIRKLHINNYSEGAEAFWVKVRAALINVGFASQKTFTNANSGNVVEVLYLDKTYEHQVDGHYDKYEENYEEDEDDE